MNDRWLKPDFQEISVAGECTAYSGTQGTGEASSLPLCRDVNERASGEGPLPSASGGDS